MESTLLVGGAGTGKTTEMLNRLQKAMERPEVGGNPLALGFSSMTRAARLTASTRAAEAWGLERTDLERDGWFATIHAVAKRCLGIGPGELIGDSKDDRQWISEAMEAQLSICLDEDDDGVPSIAGDDEACSCLRCWDLARATVTPLAEIVDRWSDRLPKCPVVDEVISRIERYEARKAADGRLDFTDMAARFVGLSFHPRHGIAKVRPQGKVPDEVVGWIFDEAQDTSKLIDLCCQRICTGESVLWACLVGDPFQAIHGWAGASAAHFQAWPHKKRSVMPRSYRCPPSIMALGEACLRECSDYWDRGILPAQHEGSITEEDVEEAIASLRPDVETLVLARTKQLRKKLVAALRRNGIPHRHTSRSKWAKDGPTTDENACLALWRLQHGQGISNVQWGQVMKSLPGGRKLLKHGSQAAWKRGLAERMDFVRPENLPAAGASEELLSVISSGQWPDLIEGGQPWFDSVSRFGVEVTMAPKVRVGTIHSVKGDEADHVVLLSSCGWRVAMSEAGSQEAADEERRVRYVAVTRARKSLVIAHDPRERYRMEIPT